MTEPLVIVVILNTNHRQDTLECLDSLLKGTYANVRTIVLDNASTDGSVEAIRASFPQVEVLQLAQNRGYAGNNNVGIEAALARGADWIFVLNEDTILDRDCVSAMMQAAESNPHIGIAGPLVYHHDEPRVIQSAGGVLNRNWEPVHLGQNEEDCDQFRETHPVDWISGCGILIRRETIQQVGTIDERYFYFWEELEWCIRAKEAGWQIVHVPSAKMWHKGVQRNYKPKPTVTYYATRNRLLTLSKHSAPVRARMFAWLQIMRTLTSWTLKPKWRSLRSHRNAMWRGMVDFLFCRWGGPVEL